MASNPFILGMITQGVEVEPFNPPHSPVLINLVSPQRTPVALSTLGNQNRNSSMMEIEPTSSSKVVAQSMLALPPSFDNKLVNQSVLPSPISLLPPAQLPLASPVRTAIPPVLPIPQSPVAMVVSPIKPSPTPILPAPAPVPQVLVEKKFSANDDIMAKENVCPTFVNESFVSQYGILDKMIGKGAFGSVYTTLGGYIAKIFAAGDSIPGDYIREVTIITALNRRSLLYVTPFRKAGVYYVDRSTPTEQSGYHPWMIVKKGDGNISQLYNHSPANRYQVAKKIAIGLKEVHQSNVIHRDIKPANILYKIVNGEIIPWINDFGISAFNTCVSSINLPVGTLIFMAPEMFGQNYSFGVDVWAYGITMLCLVTGQDVFNSWLVLNEPRGLGPQADMQRAAYWAVLKTTDGYNLRTSQFRDSLLNRNQLDDLISLMIVNMVGDFRTIGLYGFIGKLGDLLHKIFVPMNSRITMDQVEADPFFDGQGPTNQLACPTKMFDHIYFPDDPNVDNSLRLKYLYKILYLVDFIPSQLSILAGSIGLMDSIRVANRLTNLDMITIVMIMIMNYDKQLFGLTMINNYMNKLGERRVATQQNVNDNVARLAGCAQYQLYYTSILEYVHAKTKAADFPQRYPNIINQDDVMLLLALTMVIIFDPNQCKGLNTDGRVNNFIEFADAAIGSVKYGKSIGGIHNNIYYQLRGMYFGSDSGQNRGYRNYMLSNNSLVSQLDYLFRSTIPI